MERLLEGVHGGIVALVRVDRETDGALDADCMTHLGTRLADVPPTIGWDGLLVLYRHADETWATWRAQRKGDVGDWYSTRRTNALLADCIDAINAAAYVVAKAHSKKGSRPKAPAPVERPWVKAAGERHLGSGAIPQCEFLDWYYGSG
jgi:hypothetical protein